MVHPVLKGLLLIALAGQAPHVATLGVTTNVKLRVIVSDDTGVAFAGATLQLISADGRRAGLQKSDDDGIANFTVPPGKYELDVSAPGFFTDEIELAPFTEDQEFSTRMKKSVGWSDSAGFFSVIPVIPLSPTREIVDEIPVTRP